MCTEPADPAFLRTSIDQSIIHRCAEAANATRTCSEAASLVSSRKTPRFFPPLSHSPKKALRPKAPKTIDVESGYGTDTDRSCPNSPQSGGGGGWTPVNVPRSAVAKHVQSPTSAPAITSASPGRHSRKPGDKAYKKTKRASPKNDEACGEMSSSEYCPTSIAAAPKRRKMSSTLNQDARAAYTLMQLHMADAILAEKRGPKSRRASS